MLKNLNQVSTVIKFSSRKFSDLSQRLKNKTAIVTASTEGIGFSTAKRLGLEGASVIICSRKQQNVENAVNELKKLNLDVYGTVCHVGKEEDRKNLVNFALEKKGKIDIFVSNAAVNPFMGATLETPSSIWDKIFDINVKAAFELTKEVVPHIQKQENGGSIVYISSVAGYQAMPFIGCYSISKTALLGLSRTLAIELANEKIRVNCVAPGIIKTKFSQAILESDAVNSMIPMSRAGDPDEVASTVCFLVSDDASYITGECLSPGGGYFTRI